MADARVQVVFLDAKGEVIDGPSPFAADLDVTADTQPKDYAGAVRMTAALSRAQVDAARFIHEAHRQLGVRETAYRKRKAAAIAKARMEWPATVAVDMVDEVDPGIAEVREAYRAAQGLAKAADQIGYKTTKDRAAGERLVDWSMRVAPDGQYGPELTAPSDKSRGY